MLIKISFIHENNKKMKREDNLRVDFHVDTMSNVEEKKVDSSIFFPLFIFVKKE